LNTNADADTLHAWLATEGLHPSSVREPDPEALKRLDQLAPISDAAKDILRTKGVEMLLVNDVDKQITVLLKRARPTKKQLTLLPRTCGDSTIEYRQGVAKAIGGAPSQARGKPFYVVQPAGDDCYACGSSISLGNCQDAGTLGALVQDSDGVFYGLSNNHVTGGCNFAKRQMPIVAPGVFDVSPLGFDPITLGYHERSIPLVAGVPGTADIENNLDAAVFKIRDEGNVSSMQGTWYDTPVDVLDPENKMVVEKVGRTTGHTVGTIFSHTHEPLSVQYDVRGVDYSFSGQVYFSPVYLVVGKAGQDFSAEGDSGSLVTTVKDGLRYAVGILIGGAKGQGGLDYTYVLPIKPVLEKLGVTLVGGHNV
jgi:hypothetical protein